MSALDNAFDPQRPNPEPEPHDAIAFPIPRSAPALHKWIEKYHYDANRPQQETPLKDGTHDHPIDALRYLIINLDHPRTLRQENYLG